MTETHDFQDLTAPRMNEASWRAHDPLRAYAARDRAAIVEHLAHLEDDQLEFARGMSANFYNDTLSVLRDTGRPWSRPPSWGRSTRWSPSHRRSTSSRSPPPPAGWPGAR